MSDGATPADLRVRREALGLTQGWLAAQVGVQDRAVRRWEAGDRAIPGDVRDLLDEGERRADAILDAISEELLRVEVDLDEEPEGLDVVVYDSDEDLWAVHPLFAPWPASWHRAVCARARDLTDVPVRFQYGPTTGARQRRE